MELWDAYDEKLNRLDGMTLVRGEEVPDGVFHFVCEIIVRHADGTYLLMQRDHRKHLGGMWEATAGELCSMTRNELATQRILNFIEELK